MNKKWIATFKRVGRVTKGKLTWVQRKDGRYAYIDEYGREKIVLPADVRSVGDFSDGVAYVSFRGSRTVYIDEEGKTVLELPEGVSGYDFVDGIAHVFHLDTRTHGYINKNGEEIISLPDSVKIANDFSEGLALIENFKPTPGKSNFVYINEKGETVIEPAADVYMAGNFRNGVARNKHATDRDTWTDLIDKEGKPVDPPEIEIGEGVLYYPKELDDGTVALSDSDGLYMVDPSDKRNYIYAITTQSSKYFVKVPEDLVPEVADALSHPIGMFEFLSGSSDGKNGKGE